MIFETRFCQLRNETGLKQSDIAGKLNVSQGTIANWESGKRTPDAQMLLKIADFFAVSVDYLLGKTDERHYYDDHMLDIVNELDDDVLQASPYNLIEAQRLQREKDEQAQKKQPTEKQAAAIDKIKNMSPDELQQAEVFLDFIISKREDPVDE